VANKWEHPESRTFWQVSPIFDLSLLAALCPYPPPYMTYSPYMTRPYSPYTNLSFSADDVKDKYSLAVVAVEHPAGELDDLAIARAAKLPRHRSAFGVTRELVYVCEDPLDEPTCGLRVVKSDIVGDGIKVV
jgi:hypothetical protein